MKWVKGFSRYTSDRELSSRLHKKSNFFNCKKSKNSVNHDLMKWTECFQKMKYD